LQPGYYLNFSYIIKLSNDLRDVNLVTSYVTAFVSFDEQFFLVTKPTVYVTV